MKKQYLVVFEDLWNSKESYQTEHIGDTVKMILDGSGLTTENEVDFDKYNSDNPYQSGTFDNVFYDIRLLDEEEYAGRIMIFELEQWK
jgi:hypothetical protein